MILVLNKTASADEKERLMEELRSEGCLIKEMIGEEETIIGLVGKVQRDIRYFETIPGVAKVVPISTASKLVSREMHPEDSTIPVGDVAIG